MTSSASNLAEQKKLTLTNGTQIQKPEIIDKKTEKQAVKLAESLFQNISTNADQLAV